MATATKKPGAARVQLARRARDVRAPEAMEFLVFQDNGGAHHWRLVAGDDAILAHSGSFASHDDAARAAQRVREGAGSAQFERSADQPSPGDLGDGRNRHGDESDAERWLDEGGRFSNEVVEK